MEHLEDSLKSYFTHIMAESQWPEWYAEMPEFFRSSVENWMFAAYLLGVDHGRIACGLKRKR